MININTVNTKKEQLTNGYFKIGSGEEYILIVGSCRAVPYCNYLNDWNQANNNRFTVCFLDPYNWCYDLQDNRVNLEATITALEKDERILDLLKNTDIIIHEYYSNFGMFNFDKTAEKNIYQFGLAPHLDICLPNWNDCFVMFGDIVTFDIPMRKRAIADWNVLGKLSEQTQEELYNLSQKNLQRFYDVCQKSDLPEMAICVMANFKTTRFWWNSNHISKAFTLAVFKLINDKYLHLDLSKGFDENHVDMYANNYTKLTEYDLLAYGYKWGEEPISIKERLF